MEKITLSNYPVLRSLAWHMSGVDEISRHDAYSLYEHLWGYVRLEDLGSVEIELIDSLAKSEGNGVFMPSGGPPIRLPGAHCV